MGITLEHKYRWHATTEISLTCNYQINVTNTDICIYL